MRPIILALAQTKQAKHSFITCEIKDCLECERLKKLFNECDEFGREDNKTYEVEA